MDITCRAMCEHVQYCNAQTMYAISCQLNNSDLTWRHTIVVCDCVWASHRKMLIYTILLTVVNGDCEYILEKQTEVITTKLIGKNIHLNIFRLSV